MARPFWAGLAFLLLAFGWASAPAAAGLDCTSSGTPREHAICGDPALSEAYNRLSRLYPAVLARLSPAGVRVVQDGQRSWLHYVDQLCPSPDPDDRQAQADAAPCLSHVISARLRDLEAAAERVGPYLFTRVDLYNVTVLPAKASDDDDGLGKHHVAYPRIDQPVTDTTTRWNQLVVRRAAASPCGDGDDGTDYQIGAATDRLISLRWETTYFCHGSPHGYADIAAETLMLRPAPHPLAPADLFAPDQPWADRLKMLTLADVQAQVAVGRPGSTALNTEAVTAAATDPRRWLLRPAGLAILFQEYELGLGYEFNPAVVLPWTSLRQVMVVEPPIPAAP